MRSISIKLMLAFIVISLIGTAIFFGVARWNSNREIEDFLSSQDQAEIIERAASYYFENDTWEGFETSWPSPPADLSLNDNRPGPFSPFILVDINRQVVLGRGGGPDRQMHGATISEKDLEEALEITSDGDVIGWVLFTPIDWRESAPGNKIFQSIDRLLIFSAMGSAVVAVVLGIVLSRTLSRPLLELSAAAQQAATGDLSQKVEVNTKDEIGTLAKSFNQMMTDLERMIASRKQMTADIAHELRTPISVILGHAEGVYEGVMEPSLENFEIIRDEALHLERLVNDLRILSQADVGELPLEMNQAAPGQLIEEVVKATRPILQEKAIGLVTQLEPDLPKVHIDKDRMIQVIRNILDNAVRYTPEGGKITLDVRKKSDQALQFSIQDNGPGVDEQEIPKIFNRFYQIDSARTRDQYGSGLGLAIAKSIIQQHSGKIWAESSQGEGLKVIFELPLPDPESS